MSGRFSYEVQRENYRKEAKQRTEKLLVQEIPDAETQQIALDILRKLFSNIKMAFDGPLFGHRSEETDRTQKRIGSPECFERYFLLREEPDEISDKEIEVLINDWNTGELDSAEREITHKLKESKEQGTLSSLLRKLLIFVRSMNPSRVRSVLLSIARSALLYSRSSENLWSEYDNAEVLILRLIDQVAEQERMQELFLETLDSVDDQHLHFAVRLVHSCDPDRSRLDLIPRHCDVRKLREKVAARLKDFYITRGGDIFSLPDSDWIFVLAQWGIYFELADVKSDVEGLVVRKLDQSPEYLARLLKFFGTHNFGEESYRNFSRLCDPELIDQMAQRYGDSALTDEQSRSAIKRLRELHVASKSAGSVGEPGEHPPLIKSDAVS